jgi:Zn-dependent protease with chaperone function
MKKKLYLILLFLTMFSAIPQLYARNILKDILKAYKTYQEVNMTLWLVGDVGAEKRLGKELQFWMNLTNKPEKNPEINAYVKSIFNRLTPHYKNHGMSFDVRVIRNNTANAFVIPGGHVYVHTGLLNLVESDDELATVIAHELAHAERRHSLKNFRASTAAVALLNAAVKNRKDRETWGALLGYITMMRFSRTQEREADEIGQFRMAAAGFNPAAQVKVWEKFLKKYGESKGLQNYLSSHPPSSERIENARRNLAKMNVSEKTVFANTRNILDATKENLLNNPGFELSVSANGAIPGWQITEGQAQLSKKRSFTGQHSIELISNERLKRTKVLSEFIPVNSSSDLTLSGWLVSENGEQNAAVGIELYDSQKRLRNRVWAIRKSDKVPAGGARFETRLVNTAKNRIFAGNIAFMRILLQAGLISRGSVWFDDFRLKNTASKDPVNLLEVGDFETADANGVPRGINPMTTGVSIDFNRKNTGYASVKVSGKNSPSENGFTFAPIPIEKFKPGQTVMGSFFFTGNKQIRGMVIAEFLDKNLKPLEKRPALVEFETEKEKWTGTSFSFKIDSNNNLFSKARSLQIKIHANLPANESMWLDSFVLR